MVDTTVQERPAGLAATEAECAEGRTAPRVSLADIEANIKAVAYATGTSLFDESAEVRAAVSHATDTLTICLVVLQNGFTLIGKSAPADARNFDPALGRKLAYEDAVRQAWPLMGYELRERLYQRATPDYPSGAERAVA